jgi:hypothetical protein
MMIGHLKEELNGPGRYVFGIWDGTAGCYIGGAEWIAIVTDDRQKMAVRLQGTIDFFSSQGCDGVSSDVQRIMTRYGVSLSEKLKVYRTAK